MVQQKDEWIPIIWKQWESLSIIEGIQSEVILKKYWKKSLNPLNFFKGYSKEFKQKISDFCHSDSIYIYIYKTFFLMRVPFYDEKYAL